MIPRPEQNDPMHNTQSEMREKERESIESPHHQRNKTQKKKVYLLTVVNPVILCVRAIASPNPLSTQSRIV